MAQLILPAAFGAAAGTTAGFILTGIGLAVDSLLFARLAGDESVSTPVNDSVGLVRGREGESINRLWGTAKIGSQVIWDRGCFTVITDTERHSLGKGRSRNIERHSYHKSFAVAFCEGEADLVRLYFNDQPVELELDANGAGTIDGQYRVQFFRGTETQGPSSIIQAFELERARQENQIYRGVPAYRGTCYIVFEELNLTGPLGDRVPRVTALLDRKARLRGVIHQSQEQAVDDSLAGLIPTTQVPLELPLVEDSDSGELTAPPFPFPDWILTPLTIPRQNEHYPLGVPSFRFDRGRDDSDPTDYFYSGSGSRNDYLMVGLNVPAEVDRENLNLIQYDANGVEVRRMNFERDFRPLVQMRGIQFYLYSLNYDRGVEVADGEQGSGTRIFIGGDHRFRWEVTQFGAQVEDNFQTRARAMTLLPGHGESVYHPDSLRGTDGRGNAETYNAHISGEKADSIIALEAMENRFQELDLINIPVSWFFTGGECKPGVESKTREIDREPWSVAGVSRSDDDAVLVSATGGTPSDASIIRLIARLLSEGKDVGLTMKLIDLDGNGIAYSSGFFGSAAVGNFSIDSSGRLPVVEYSGVADDFGYRRMVLHYANLAKAAYDAYANSNPTLNSRGLPVNRLFHFFVGDSLKGVTHSFERTGGDSISFLDFASATNLNSQETTTSMIFRLLPMQWPESLDNQADYNTFPNNVLTNRNASQGNRREVPQDFVAGTYYLSSFGIRFWLMRITQPDTRIIHYDSAGNRLGSYALADLRPLFSVVPNILEAHALDVPIFVSPGDYFTYDIVPTATGTDRAFPGADAMAQLITDSTPILAERYTRVGYIAAHDEYHSHQAEGNVWWNMDAIWRASVSGGIGIRWQFPLSDWRVDGGLDEGEGVDPDFGFPRGRDIYDLNYLTGQIEGGEGYDYHYASEADRESQTRTPIADPEGDKHWIFRPKDIRSWRNLDHDYTGLDGVRRTGGRARNANDLDFFPSPAVWLIFSCHAVDKATNAPDSLSPPFSTGEGNDLIQRRYFEALTAYWSDPENRVRNTLLHGLTTRLNGGIIEGFDIRPHPIYPQRGDIFPDANAYATGISLSGRTGSTFLYEVVRDICLEAGLSLGEIDVSALQTEILNFTGYVAPSQASARNLLRPLFSTYFFDGFESGGRLTFRPRDSAATIEIDDGHLVPTGDSSSTETALPEGYTISRKPDSEVAKRITLNFLDMEKDYSPGSETSTLDAISTDTQATLEANVVMNGATARSIADVSLQEQLIGREEAELNLPIRYSQIEPTDIINFDGRQMRVMSVERGDFLQIKARVDDPLIYDQSTFIHREGHSVSIATPDLSYAEPIGYLLDIPFFEQESGAPVQVFFCAYANPFPPAVNLFRVRFDSEGRIADYGPPVATVGAPAMVGEITTAIPAGTPWLIDRGTAFNVRLFDRNAELESVSETQMLDRLDTQTIAIRRRASPQDGWELKQWATAQFQGNDAAGFPIYRISTLLHGVCSTDTQIREYEVGDEVIFLSRASLATFTPPEELINEPQLFVAVPSTSEPGLQFSNLAIRYPMRLNVGAPAPVNIRRTRTSGSGGDEVFRIEWNRRAYHGLGAESLDADNFDTRSIGVRFEIWIWPYDPDETYFTAEQLQDPNSQILRRVATGGTGVNLNASYWRDLVNWQGGRYNVIMAERFRDWYGQTAQAVI